MKTRLFRSPAVASRLRTAVVWAGVAALPVVVLLAPSLVGSRAGVGILGVSLPLRYVVPALVVALPAGLLRRRPLLALGLMLAGATLVTATVHSWENGYLAGIWHLQFLGIDAVVGLIAARRARRVSVPAAVAVVVVQVGASFLNSAADPLDRALLSVLAVATAWMIGDSARATRRHIEELRYRATADAVAAERLRVAREVHDMVAHSVGVIAIQAGVGARVIDTQPDQARAALTTIEETSRETLAELRRTLRALRRPEEAAASLDPPPGLADLDRLVTAGADAGIRVEVRRRGEPSPLSADVDLAAFRIVQEAVTNVVRHAATDECQVLVDRRPDEVCLEIVDGGRGGLVGEAGHGLVGMRERAELLGGRFTAGPRPEGGFRVTARLPAVPAGPSTATPADPPHDDRAPALPGGSDAAPAERPAGPATATDPASAGAR
ncbi:sensor histidine kinase [Plantactinospora sp. GCM10030261]|uniref:sensor histidine kinase n=1 Tax=Plantactinospora sp. GCM10030261 TaxID=3273420 RepID=UPI00360F9E35